MPNGDVIQRTLEVYSNFKDLRIFGNWEIGVGLILLDYLASLEAHYSQVIRIKLIFLKSF